MDYKQKSQQFRVSIRRKNLNEKMAAMRAKQSSTYSALQNPQATIDRISSILSTGNSINIYNNITQLKMASQDPQVMMILKGNFEVFYKCIIEVDSVLKDKDKDKGEVERVFNDLATILINITSQEFINFTQQITEDIATPLIINIHKPLRQISTLWLISNLLYRHNLLSRHFMSMLVKWGVVSYIKERINLAFDSDTQMTIFYYFVGAFAANLDALTFAEYREALNVMEILGQLQIEELYWYLLDGLIEHASSFNRFKYQIFATKVLFKCQGYCKAKKSRFVIKYLELISHFLQGESQEIHRTNEQNRKKVFAQQYQRLKNNKILKNLQFCLQNRSPQVKRHLFEIGYMLVAMYMNQISFIDQYFYLTLAQQIKGVQKYEERTIVWFLTYFKTLISSLLLDGSISRSKQYTQIFIKFVESTGLFDKLSYLMQHFNSSHQLLNICMDIIAFLLQYDIPSVNAALRRARMVPILEKLEIEDMGINNKREKLLDVLGDQRL